MKKLIFISLTLCGVVLNMKGQGTTYNWTGAIDTLWTNAGNWQPASVPTAIDFVIIPSGPVNMPVILLQQECSSLTIESNMSLRIDGNGSLATNASSVSGALTVQGTLNSGGGLNIFPGGNVLNTGQLTTGDLSLSLGLFINGGVCTIFNNMNINGDVVNAGLINLTGDLHRNSVLGGTNNFGTLVLTGPNATRRVIDGSITASSITIDDIVGREATPGTEIIIDNTLEMVNGQLFIPSGDTIRLNAGAIAAGNANSYVIGTMTQSNTQQGIVMSFPIGIDSMTYAPVELIPTQPSGVFTITAGHFSSPALSINQPLGILLNSSEWLIETTQPCTSTFFYDYVTSLDSVSVTFLSQALTGAYTNGNGPWDNVVPVGLDTLVRLSVSLPITTNGIYSLGILNTVLANNHIPDFSIQASLYPNPCRDFLHIEAQSIIEQVLFFDQAGRLIEQFSGNGNPTLDLNMSTFAAGQYLCFIATREGSTMKVIVR